MNSVGPILIFGRTTTRLSGLFITTVDYQVEGSFVVLSCYETGDRYSWVSIPASACAVCTQCKNLALDRYVNASLQN